MKEKGDQGGGKREKRESKRMSKAEFLFAFTCSTAWGSGRVGGVGGGGRGGGREGRGKGGGRERGGGGEEEG